MNVPSTVCADPRCGHGGPDRGLGRPDFRILDRIDIRPGPTGRDPQGDRVTRALVVDVETTGLDLDEDVIIELAMRPFVYDGLGHVLEIGEGRSWREDPGVPLAPEIVALTGLTDADLSWQFIDDEEVLALVAYADLLIAHNAAFDRPMFERRFPNAPLCAWACSCEEVDWRGAGFEGRSLGYLVMQAGWFHDGHRALNDVDAVVQLLRHEDTDGLPLLNQLDARARADSHLVEATGASYGARAALKSRGYRWNPGRRVWWREVADDVLPVEEAWLARAVYAAGCGARARAPDVTRRNAFSRYR